MMEYEKIERYVSDLLRLSGLDMEEGSASGTLLFHAYVAVAMYELMNAEERALIKGMQRRMKYFFSSNFSLKERKRKTEKEILPPNPLSIEKEKKEKEEKQRERAGREISLEFSDFETRLNDFKMKVWNARGNTDTEMLNEFFFYWTDVNPKTGRMRFEEKRYFKVENQLKLWKENEFTSKNAAAKMRLNKARQKQTQERTEAEKSQQAAAEREQADAEREARTEKSRQEQMLTEDYIREHPDSLMAKIYRQKKKKKKE